MNEFIKRSDVVDLSIDDWNADVTERFERNWSRVSAMVADQGDAEASVDGLDFLLFELYLSGSHRVHFSGDFVTGDRWAGRYLPGHINFFQAGSPVQMSIEGRAKVQQVYIERSVFTECAGSVLKGDPDRLDVRGFHGVFDPRLKFLSECLQEEARCPALGSDLNAELTAQHMALLILRTQNAKRARTLTDKILSDWELARVIGYLEDQIEDVGGMDTLARLVDMDVFSFTKAFKATTGESPGQFLIQRRLARVKDLLRTTNDTLADITYATGFSNQPHMTSTFTKHVGVSPGKWRKAVRS